MSSTIQTLIIVRGWQGSGKSTFASKLRQIVKDFHYPEFNTRHYEADMYFYKDGKYNFEFSKLKNAHAWCKESVEKSINSGVYLTIVANTFRTSKEIEPYLKMAKDAGVQVCIYECVGNFKNVHDVPEDIVEKYKTEFVYNKELSKLENFRDVRFYTVCGNTVKESINH